MKKTFCIFLAVLFSLFSSISFASSTLYYVEEAGLSITIPDNMYVFDRNVSPSDERLFSLGLSYEGLTASFASQNIYLDAIDIETYSEILVIAGPTEEKDFSSLAPDALYNAVLSEENTLIQNGRTIEKADLFELGNIDFVKTISKANDTFMQYTTVYNGKKITIRFIDLDDDFTDEKAEKFEEIVETVTFDPAENSSKKDSANVSQPASEIDDKSGSNTVGKTEAESDSQSSNESKSAPQDIAEEKSDVSKPDSVPVITDSGSSANEDASLLGALVKIVLIILSAIVICSIPVLIFRYVFAGGGIRQKGAKVFAFFYTLAMTAIFYYIITNHKELNLSLFICFVPLFWSFVVYKIVKR